MSSEQPSPGAGREEDRKLLAEWLKRARAIPEVPATAMLEDPCWQEVCRAAGRGGLQEFYNQHGDAVKNLIGELLERWEWEWGGPRTVNSFNPLTWPKVPGVHNMLRRKLVQLVQIMRKELTPSTSLGPDRDLRDRVAAAVRKAPADGWTLRTLADHAECSHRHLQRMSQTYQKAGILKKLKKNRRFIAGEKAL